MVQSTDKNIHKTKEIPTDKFNGRPVVYKIDNLKVHFPVKSNFFKKGFKGEDTKYVKAVDGISLKVREGETIGIAGESGCGKSTLARTLVKLEEPSSGEIYFHGVDVSSIKSKQMKKFRKDAQMVFQDPYESLNPRFSIRQTLEESLIIQKMGNREERTAQILETLNRVGLKPADKYIDRYPHEMSGGQRQRVAIARALVMKPKFLVADEPVSMLDVSIRASILNLLKELVDELNLASVYISHDLSLIRYVCDKTAIMYLGRIVEFGDTEDVIKTPLHPYSQGLLSAVPSPEPNPDGLSIAIEGEAPNAINIPSGCRFHTRCPFVMDHCKKVEPKSISYNGRWVECHLYDEELQMAKS